MGVPIIQTEFFDCACHSKEHLIAFEYVPDDNLLSTHISLNHYLPWYKRIVVAFKYVFSIKRNGHSDWNVWLLHWQDAQRLKTFFDQVKVIN